MQRTIFAAFLLLCVLGVSAQGSQSAQRTQNSSTSLSSTNASKPYELRLLNHWDNLDGTVERGCAGHSIFWNNGNHTDYKAYARELQQEGYNGTVLNNVNASPKILSEVYLDSVKNIADQLRPFGIKVYLSVNFASPMVLGKLKTADPLNKAVQKWWQAKVKQIYERIPDFGGFLVKANSEGQPGPMDYKRTHADGANMLADALLPYKGIVMWRAFVYSPNDADRAKQAYIEFQPLDGQFRDNVIIQVKNGPIDFQPREPFSPLFAAMPKTKIMMEVQITQEYLGSANHVVYLAPMWEEAMKDVLTLLPREGGEANNFVGFAGVSNRGNNPKGNHVFHRLNEYALGQIALNNGKNSGAILVEWLFMNITKDKKAIIEIGKMLMQTREAEVNFMMPLGLHHLFAWGHHYGPEPWCDIPGARADWLPKYYHQADAVGLGFNRSSTGSNAVSQYPERLASMLDNIETCPEKYILWFHHVPWTFKMKSGKTMWDELCLHYQKGLDQTTHFITTWVKQRKHLAPEIFDDVLQRLIIQNHDAQWWKDACLLYFQTFSKLPFPEGCAPAVYNLETLKKIKLPISNYENPTEDMLDF